MTKIAVIIGSIREGRVTDKLAKWAYEEVSKLAEAEIVDLKDYPLPLFNEAIPPRYNPDRTPVPEIKRWLEKIAEFDGYVLVTPEYNRALPGTLKNAIDTLGNETNDKPVALIGHGSSGGAQAIASLRMTLPGIGLVTLPTALFFTDRVGEAIDENGVLKQELLDNPMGPQNQLVSLAATIVRYSEALKVVRS